MLYYHEDIVTDLRNFVLKVLVKVSISLYFLNMLMNQFNILFIGRYWPEDYNPPG